MEATQDDEARKHREECSDFRSQAQKTKGIHKREIDENKSLKLKQDTKIGDEGLQNRMMEQKKLFKQNDVAKNSSLMGFESKADDRTITKEKIKSLQKDKWNLGNMDLLEHKNNLNKEWENDENNQRKMKMDQTNKWNQSELDCDSQRLNKILEWKSHGKELRGMMDDRENKFFGHD